jgi:hypothetical protein
MEEFSDYFQRTFFFFLAILGLELRASHLLDRHLLLEPLHMPFFYDGLFEIGS